MPSFPMGNTVRIKGLSKAPQYNGMEGTVKSVLSEDGRILIQLSDKSTIRVRPENLEVMEEGGDEIPPLISSSEDEEKGKSNSKPRSKQVSQIKQPSCSNPVKCSQQPVIGNSCTRQVPIAQKSTHITKNPPVKGNVKDPGSESEDIPDLVESSDDETPHQTSNVSVCKGAQPVPQTAKPAPPAERKQVQPPNPPIPQSSKSPQQPPPRPPDPKRELLQFISRLMEEGRSAFVRMEFEIGRAKFSEIVSLLERSPEKQHFQMQHARAYTWVAEGYLQLGDHDPAIKNATTAIKLWKTVKEEENDFETCMQSYLCIALALKGRGEFKSAVTKFQECISMWTAKFGEIEHEFIRKARLAQRWSNLYVTLPRGRVVLLERTDKKENFNRKGMLMTNEKLEVIALNNGMDQIVHKGDYREIRDSEQCNGRLPNREKSDQIVDGMNVVVGGEDTGPDYGLEGIVVNVEENKLVDGGKMCLVMLNEDPTKMLMVPVSNLLVGEAGKQGVMRRKALRELQSQVKVAPSSSELVAMLREFRERGLSLKKMLNEIRTTRPNWEVSEKRLKKTLKELEWEGEAGVGRSAQVTDKAAGGGARCDDVTSAVDEIDERSVSMVAKLESVKSFIMPQLECQVCLEEMNQVEGNVHYHTPIIIKACGHTLCEECFKGIDSKSEEAYNKMKRKERGVKWPTCPACNMELIIENDKAAKESRGVKNYLLCDVIDILHGRTQPRDS